MGLRILHTSDWHLGHTLHDVPRRREHAQFLAWLLDALERERVDALLIAGDVFETANPPATAQAMWYGFLADVRDRLPDLDVVAVGGNHDSAARLDAPEPLLRPLRIHIVGGLPRGGKDTGRALDLDRLIAPLTDRDGHVAALVAAVPFLRPADLPRVRGAATAADPNADPNADPGPDSGPDSGPDLNPDRPADDTEQPSGPDPLIEGVRHLYAEVLDAIRARCRPGQAIVATGHCYMAHGSISALSERRILGGNQHALPADIFPEDVAYVALGHLHKAQRVAGRDRVRYSGAPIALAMNEARYRHQALLVDLDGERVSDIRTLDIPTTVDFARVPARGAAPLDQILPALAALPDESETDDPALRPYLEVCVALDRPDVTLRQRIDDAVVGKRARLLKLTVEYTGHGMALADVAPPIELRDLDPTEVFARRYRRDHDGDPPPDLVEAFCELLEQAHAEVGG